MIYALVDGGSRNNQDPNKRQAYGTFLIVEGPSPFEMQDTTTIARETIQFGNRTNNEAEYMICIACLKFCLKQGISISHIATDSMLVYLQLAGSYKVRDKKISLLFDEVRLLLKLAGAEVNKISREVTVFYLGH